MRTLATIGVVCLFLLPVAALSAAALPDEPDRTTVIKREMIREAARISDIGQATAREWLLKAFDENITEQMVVDAVNAEMTNNGSSPYVEAFQTIVASGEDSAIPHGDYSNDATNLILPGEVVVVDLGARYRGWVSDNTKTYYMGSDPPTNYTERYMLVYEAQQLAIAEVRTLVQASYLDAVARKHIEAGGYDIPHCVGHGVGLYVHVNPFICPNSNDILNSARDDVVSIEPGIYVAGEFGIRIEDDYAVLRTGYERYTFAPSEYAASLIYPMNDTEEQGALTLPSGPGREAIILNLAVVIGLVLIAVLSYLAYTRVVSPRLRRGSSAPDDL